MFFSATVLNLILFNIHTVTLFSRVSPDADHTPSRATLATRPSGSLHTGIWLRMLHVYHRLRGNARGFTVSRYTLKLNMYALIDVESKNVHSPHRAQNIKAWSPPRPCRWPQHDTCSQITVAPVRPHTGGKRESGSSETLRQQLKRPGLAVEVDTRCVALGTE